MNRLIATARLSNSLLRLVPDRSSYDPSGRKALLILNAILWLVEFALNKQLLINSALIVAVMILGSGVVVVDAQQSYSAKITNVSSYPPTVKVKGYASIRIDIQYSFPPATPVSTRVRLFEADTNKLLKEDIKILEGQGTRTFDFSQETPELPREWGLKAEVHYLVGYAWLLLDERPFSIQVKGDFTLQIHGLPLGVGWVLVDSAQQTVGPSGIFVMTLSTGTHTVEVPREHVEPLKKRTRQIFKEWKDIGFPLNSRDIVMEEDKIFYLAYETQHNLLLQSDVVVELGQTNSDGWYREGSSAEISLRSTEVPESGLLGVLGVRRVFDYWMMEDGRTIPLSRTSVVMTQPQTIRAKWKTDYGYLYVSLGIVTAIVVAIVAILLIRSRRRPPPSRPLITGTSFGVPLRPAPVAPPLLRVQPVRERRFCTQCGAEIDAAARRCPSCGREQ